MSTLLDEYQKLPVGILILDHSWFVTSANQVFCQLFDCELEEVVQQSFEALIHPNDRKEIQGFEQKMKKAGNQAFYIRLDLRIRGRDLPCRIRAVEESGCLLLFIERLEVDQQLKDQLVLMKKRWSALHDFIEDGILVVDEELNIVEVNQQLLAALDFHTKDGILLGEDLLIGKKLFSFMNEKEFNDIKANVEASRADPDKVSSGNYWFKSKLLHIRTSPIFIPKKGFQGSCLVVRDITDQYRAEETLLKKTIVIQLLQSVAVASNEAKSAEEALFAAVKNVCLYTGWSLGHVYLPAKGIPNELISSNIWFPERSAANEAFIRDVEEKESLALDEDLPGRVMKSSKAEWIADLAQDETFLRRKLVESHGMRCGFAFPVVLMGEISAVLEFFSPHTLELDRSLMDISVHLGAQLARVFERERAQSIIGDQQVKIAANTKLSALGEMAGGIAHEINNPLAVIHTLAGQLKELAAENAIDQKVVTKIAQTIESTVMRIAKIVKGLRSFARDGENDPLEPVSIRSIVEDTMAFCVERLKNKGISIAYEDYSSDMTISCRGVQIAQVLLNLVNNSHDAVGDLPGYDKWIKIESWERGNYLEMTVTDCGKGIPIEQQDRIFQPFFTTKEIGKGTGMGLSISRAIINDHQGELFLDSAHTSTRFVILLPRNPQPHPFF